jgi:hypothetical protein
MKSLKPSILDDAATVDYQRLDLMSEILDPCTLEYLRGLGVGQGRHCLELGRATAGQDGRAELPRPGSRNTVFQAFSVEVRDRVIDSGVLSAEALGAASCLLDADYWTPVRKSIE